MYNLYEDKSTVVYKEITHNSITVYDYSQYDPIHLEKCIKDKKFTPENYVNKVRARLFSDSYKANEYNSSRVVEGDLYFSYSDYEHKLAHSNYWVPTYYNPDEGEGTVLTSIDQTTLCRFSGFFDNTSFEELTDKEKDLFTRYKENTVWLGKKIFTNDLCDVIDSDLSTRLMRVYFVYGAFSLLDESLTNKLILVDALINNKVKVQPNNNINDFKVNLWRW